MKFFSFFFSFSFVYNFFQNAFKAKNIKDVPLFQFQIFTKSSDLLNISKNLGENY